MRTDGNLATVPKPRPGTKRVTRKIIRKKALPVKEKLLYLGTVIIFVCLTSFVLVQQAELARINYEIQQIEKETLDIQSQISTLEAEEKKLLNPERIKRMARENGLIFNPANIHTLQKRNEDSTDGVQSNF